MTLVESRDAQFGRARRRRLRRRIHTSASRSSALNLLRDWRVQRTRPPLNRRTPPSPERKDPASADYPDKAGRLNVGIICYDASGRRASGQSSRTELGKALGEARPPDSNLISTDTPFRFGE